MANRCGNRPSSRYGQLHIWRVDRLSSPSHRMATNPSSPCSGTPEADLWKVHALAVAIALFMFLLSCYLSARNRHHQAAHKVALSYMRRTEDAPRAELSVPGSQYVLRTSHLVARSNSLLGPISVRPSRLGTKTLDEVNLHLRERGIKIMSGMMIEDKTIIYAPDQRKNQEGQRRKTKAVSQ